MKSSIKDVLIYFLSILSLTYFIYLSVNSLNKKPIDIINFINSNIHEDFELDITNNLDNINKYLDEYAFIESHLLKKENNKIYIQIKLKKSFAINHITKEVIFYDNTTAPLTYFKQNYLDSINLIDKSRSSIRINNHLNEHYASLSSLFDVKQIEYVEDRRYNLILSDGRIVMLPKVIDSKLLYFIKNNIDLINKSTNYRHFLDLRNFHHKTIRLK